MNAASIFTWKTTTKHALLGRGIVRKIDKRASAGGGRFRLTGQTQPMSSKTSRHTAIEIRYTAIEDIVTDLLALAGYTAVVEPDLPNANTRDGFDGANILKALEGTKKQNGIHFRERQ